MRSGLAPRGSSPVARVVFAAGAVLVGSLALRVEPRAVDASRSRASVAAAPEPAGVAATTSATASTTSSTTSSPKTVTVLTDSVALGEKDVLAAALPGWQVELVGKPALMVKQAVAQYLPPDKQVGTIVVIGLGYNSVWQRNRTNFDVWAAQFDREADTLVAALRARGAHKIVWVTLREPSLQVVTASGRRQYDQYAWFFPYVNERLRLLVQRQPDVALADWAAVSNRTGLTYDLIHLTPDGARLMAQTIAREIGP